MENKKINFKKYFVYAVILFIYSVILIGITTMVVTSKSNGTSAKKNNKVEDIIPGNSICNLTSYNNNIIKYGNWLIFSTGVEFDNGLYSNSLEGIYKYNLDNGQVISLSDYNGSNFNIYENKLYYLNEFGDIYTIDFANNDKSDWIAFINHSSYDASYLLVYGKDVYYTDSNGNNIYKTDLSGNKKILVAEYTTGPFQIVDGYIYYRENQSCKLYRKDLDSDASSEIIIEEAIGDFYIENGKIYYKLGDTLKSYDFTSKDTKTLIDNITSNFIIDKGNVYYYSSKSKAIEQYNTENSEKKKLVENLQKDIYRIQGYDNMLFYKIDTNNSRATIECYNIEEGKTNTINLKAK